jgi:hypothetical protein
MLNLTTIIRSKMYTDSNIYFYVSGKLHYSCYCDSRK